MDFVFAKLGTFRAERFRALPPRTTSKYTRAINSVHRVQLVLDDEDAFDACARARGIR